MNSGQNGYYRVLYDEDNWGSMVEELKANHETFSPLVRRKFNDTKTILRATGFLIFTYTIVCLSVWNHSGSYRFTIRCIYTMPCQFDAMPNNHESGVISAERAKLGPDDNGATASRKMASNFEI